LLPALGKITTRILGVYIEGGLRAFCCFFTFTISVCL